MVLCARTSDQGTVADRKDCLLSHLAACSLAATVLASPAFATGLESVEFPQLQAPDGFSKLSSASQQKLDEAEDSFQNSSTLKELLARSEQNKEKNKKEIQNKYCYRQAELGVGDCGGLRYIPGLTQNGKQKTPKWLADILGVEVQEEQKSEVTLQELIEK